ncbi:MAG: PAS domain-containing protein [Planctomycetaceae bacterium]
MSAPSPHAIRRAQSEAASDAWFAHAPVVAYTRQIEDADPPRAGVTTAIGPQAEELLGYPPGDFVRDGGLWASRIHPDDLGRVLATWRRAAAPGDRYHLAYRMLARDGRVVQVLDDAAVAEDPQTGVRSWHGAVVDVTADRPVGPDLREAEEKYRLLVEQIPAVTYIDEVPEDDQTDLSPSYISPQIAPLLGYRPEEWLSDPDLWDRVTHPDDVAATEAAARRCFEDGTPLSIEYRMIARDGRVVWVREQASLYRNSEGAPRFWQGVYIDITELKRAEEELNNALVRERDASEQLRALDEMKNTFLQAVSHDLRTPLAAILGLALTLEQEEFVLSEEDVRDMARRIATNSRKLDRMVRDLLDLDRLSRGIIGPKLQRADVGAIVRDLVAQTDIAEGRRLILDVESVSIEVDASKLERIVENLLANTVRHTPEGAHVWIRTRAHDGGAEIVVEDDGPGVPPELHEAVFEPFRQGPSQSSHSPGAGVGLALVARFAELHLGRAWVEDRPGGGASFHVFLPGAPSA